MRHTTIRGLAAAAVAGLAAVSIAPSPAVAATPAITCEYILWAKWRGGFGADIEVRNTGPAISNWVVRWSFDHPTTVVTTWNAVLTQTPDQVATATSVPWNTTLATNALLRFGWSAVAAVTEVPTDLTVNGVPC
ncbi:hypothetical protein GCM10009682_57310 [Luedemannella flava]|uniref:CBM2 domain-containing protein n=1 Tax=Luedemannella flava TaxID=349316 RepID=A0ABN2MLZ3_9ACTN